MADQYATGLQFSNYVCDSKSSLLFIQRLNSFNTFAVLKVVGQPEWCMYSACRAATEYFLHFLLIIECYTYISNILHYSI